MLGVVLPALVRHRAKPDRSAVEGAVCVVEGEIPAAEVHSLTRRLPGLTGGEGLLETAFGHYRPARQG